MKKIVSFQIVQGYSKAVSSSITGYISGNSWSPDVIALCEDGSLWIMPLSGYEKGYNNWTKLTSEFENNRY